MNNQNPDSNPIINKIKKLLALAADNNATEGERDNALRMAHGLLAKHNLDMSMVHASQRAEGREEHVNATWSMVWCRTVSHRVARLFFCNYYSGRKINGTKCNHHFIGKSSNVATAALMADYVIHSIMKEYRSKGWHNLSAEGRSFAMGATRVISERVSALMQTPEGASDSTALVVRNLYKSETEANTEFIKAAGTTLTTRKVRSSPVVGSAYREGKEFGSKVGLDVQIRNNQTLAIGN
jgi:hypothetical protein